jgi:hypothetical protein
LEEGKKFNGINLWLGNLLAADEGHEKHDITIFTHNQET